MWDRRFQVLRAAGGLKVTAAGLTGRRQRTLDYWAELRLALQDPATAARLRRADLTGLRSATAAEV